jgi:LuxR family maltose regulon positive regulatory protein
MGTTALHKLATGQLHETYKLTQQAMLLGTQPGGSVVVPDVGWAALWQADILREWNQLDAALELAEEAISLCKQTQSINSLTFILHGHGELLRIHLSRGELEAACSAFQEFERIGRSMNQPYYSFVRSLFTTIDQVRLWLACGELKRARHWAEELDLGERHDTPFAREREEVARARILLAMAQPTVALERLEPALVRATAGQRWDHVIEIRILQALAFQMCHYESRALSALSVAVHLAEPEDYIRRFLDEGAPMAALISKLREKQREQGPTPYLDTLLTAFSQQSKRPKHQSKTRPRQRAKRPLLDE